MTVAVYTVPSTPTMDVNDSALRSCEKTNDEPKIHHDTMREETQGTTLVLGMKMLY